MSKGFNRIDAIILVTLLAASAFVALAPSIFAGNPQTGNGAPSGKHWNLNLIGIPKAKQNGNWPANEITMALKSVRFFSRNE